MTPLALAIPAPIPFPLELTLSWAPVLILAALGVLDLLAVRLLRAATRSFKTSVSGTALPPRAPGVPLHGAAGAQRRPLPPLAA